MKKILIIFILVIATYIFTYAQSTELDNPTNAKVIEVETGRLLLREISVATLDDPTVWDAIVPFDKGSIKLQRFLGSPFDKEPLRVDEQINDFNPLDKYVIGIKTKFYGRDFITIDVEAKHEILVPGVVKNITFWVSGREKDHELSIVIRGMDGVVRVLPAGRVNFEGWNKVTVAIPARIPQKDITNTNLHGVYFLGFRLKTSFEDTVGNYYIYLDDIRAVSDVIDEVIKSSSADDIADGW